MKDTTLGVYFKGMQGHDMEVTGDIKEAAQFPSIRVEQVLKELAEIPNDMVWESEALPAERTKVFAYRGLIGIKSTWDAEGLINDPTADGQLGFVIDASHVDISEEALGLLKKIKKSSDDIGDVMAYKAQDGMTIFAWMGGIQRVLTNQHEADNEYDPSTLTTTEVEIPEDFKEYVDNSWAELGPLVIV